LGAADPVILSLLEEALFVPVERLPKNHQIGDGKSSLQHVRHDADLRRRLTAMSRVRVHLSGKPEKLLRISDADRQPLIRRTQLAITRTDEVLFELALLWGLKPSEGLFDEFARIVALYGRRAGGRN